MSARDRAGPATVASGQLAQERNLRLHLGDTDPSGLAAEQLLAQPRVPPGVVRRGQRLRLKLDRGWWRRAWLEPLRALRHRRLGTDASGPPRFLVRIDEFPDAASFYEGGDLVREAARFHELMTEAGVPYLIALLPEPAIEPFNPRASGSRSLSQPELELIARMAGDGVAFAQHGTTHRTRWLSPRRHSELVGLAPGETAALLDRGHQVLEGLGIATRVFVPPFNRFSARQYPVLADRFDVVCAGPESVLHVGFHGGPLWWSDAVYLPSYPPLYGRSGEVLAEARDLIDRRPGTWVPITLHLSWETEHDFRALRELLAEIAPYTASWQELLAAVDRSRGPRAG